MGLNLSHFWDKLNDILRILKEMEASITRSRFGGGGGGVSTNVNIDNSGVESKLTTLIGHVDEVEANQTDIKTKLDTLDASTQEVAVNTDSAGAGSALVSGGSTIAASMISGGLSVAGALVSGGASVLVGTATGKTNADLLEDIDTNTDGLEGLLGDVKTKLDSIIANQDQAGGDIFLDSIDSGHTKLTVRPDAGEKIKLIMPRFLNNHASASRTATLKWTDGTNPYDMGGTTGALSGPGGTTVLTNRNTFGELIITRDKFLLIELNGVADANEFDFTCAFENIVGSNPPTGVSS